MRNFKIELFAILLIVLALLSSCKKEQTPVESPQQNMKSYSGVFTQTDFDISLLSFKSAPLNAHRFWSLYRHPILTPNSGAWEFVDGNEFVAGTLAQLYWPGLRLTGLTWESHINDIAYGIPLHILYTPNVPLKLITQTVTASPENKLLYLAVKNFTPTQDYTLNLTGRELRDILSLDLSALKIDGYRFTITLTYNVKNIDVNATALASDGTDTGYPTYVYSTTTAVTHTFVCDRHGNTYTLDGHSDSNFDTQSLFTLLDQYSVKVTDLNVGWVIEQLSQSSGSASTYVAYKAQTPYAITDNVPGLGLKLIFMTALKSYSNGVVNETDVDIMVLQKQINLDDAKVVTTDPDGNAFGIVTIGTQTWMAEDLKTTHYNDGTAIPNVTDNATWAGLATGAYCWYNNDAATYKNTYGPLYNWYAVNTGKLCPTGWHVPTNGEWSTLTTYLGGEIVAGGKLKETGYSHWKTPNTGATNETGFTALPGGYRDNKGAFSSITHFSNGWSSTEYSSTNAWNRYLSYDFDRISRINSYKVNGFPVRCLRDN